MDIRGHDRVVMLSDSRALPEVRGHERGLQRVTLELRVRSGLDELECELIFCVGHGAADPSVDRRSRDGDRIDVHVSGGRIVRSGLAGSVFDESRRGDGRCQRREVVSEQDIFELDLRPVVPFHPFDAEERDPLTCATRDALHVREDTNLTCLELPVSVDIRADHRVRQHFLRLRIRLDGSLPNWVQCVRRPHVRPEEESANQIPRLHLVLHTHVDDEGCGLRRRVLGYRVNEEDGHEHRQYNQHDYPHVSRQVTPPPLRGVLVVRPTAVPSSDGPNCIKPDWYGPLYALRVEEEAGVHTSVARYTWCPPRNTVFKMPRFCRRRGL